MSIATNSQVQQYSDSVLRPVCEQIRSLQLVCANVKATIGDIYSNVTASNPSTTWIDGNSSNPPHLLLPSDIAAINTVVTGILSLLGGDGNTTNMSNAVSQYSIILEACVRPITGQ